MPRSTRSCGRNAMTADALACSSCRTKSSPPLRARSSPNCSNSSATVSPRARSRARMLNELYQRGMFHHHRQNKADNRKAQEYFRRALLKDPQSPQATAALSIALTIAAYLSWAEDPERNYAEAFELGERAVALDGRSEERRVG